LNVGVAACSSLWQITIVASNSITKPGQVTSGRPAPAETPRR